MKNYLRLRKLSIMYNHFVYVDTDTRLADQVFIMNELKVHFLGDMIKDGCGYVLVFCKVKKKDTEKFLQSLSQLENKIELRGYSGYEEFYNSFFTNIERSRNEGLK